MLRLALLLWLTLTSLGLAQTTEISEPSGGFAFTIPQGWQTREFPGLKYKVAYGTPVKGFAPNIVVVDEQFAGSIGEYTALNLKNIAQVFVDFRNLGQTPFLTQSGLQGVRLVTQARQQKVLLRQVFYLLPGQGDKKYVLTFSALLEEGDKYDSAVDAAIKTFVLR